jgi:fatty-acyl-CoA synthase
MDELIATRVAPSQSPQCSKGPWLPGAAPAPGRLARAWLKSREDVLAIEAHEPADLLPGATIHDCIACAAQAHPEKPAIIQLLSADLTAAPRIISYRDLVASIEQAANLFHTLSEGERPSVAIILPMLPEGLIATWGASTAGVACPINPYLETRVIASIMNAARATVLVTTHAKYGPGAWDHLDGICRAVPTLRHVVEFDSADPGRDYATLVAAQPKGRFVFTPVRDPDAEATYLPTGGTTAAPKLVRMSHRGHLLNAWLVGAFTGPEPDGVFGHAMPNFHIGGLGVIGLRTVLYGQTLLTLTADGFRSREVVSHFWDIARQYHMTNVLATPTTAAALLAVPEATSQGHCIRTFNCGASTVPVELMRGFHERFGIWLREVWGQSELHGVVTANFNDGREPHVGSVGLRLPYQPVKAIEVDADNRFVRECRLGERGVIAVCGPGVSKGYVDASLDKDFFVTGMPDGQRWANTGDIGTIDAQGFVWLFGRAKDLIIRGGHNIDPKLIEEVLCTHPSVLMVAAIGMPDAAKGEMPIAYVALKQGQSVTQAVLMDFCREHIQERAALPAEIIFLPELPLTAVGKISKPTLRMDAMSRVTASVARQVLGDQAQIDVRVDDAGLRPCAVLHVSLHPGDPQLALRHLSEALGAYSFAHRITLA